MVDEKEGTGNEWLPVVEIGGNEYVVDVAHRKLCLFDDPESTIDMHTEEAKRLLACVGGAEWRCYTRRDVWEKMRVAV